MKLEVSSILKDFYFFLYDDWGYYKMFFYYFCNILNFGVGYGIDYCRARTEECGALTNKSLMPRDQKIGKR